MADVNNRRRTYIVRMDFQKDFIIKYCSLVLISAVILSLIVYFLCGTAVTTAFKGSHLKVLSTNDFILPYLFWSASIAVVCAVAVCWHMTMIVSNRLAGPLYRIEHDIAQVAQGNLTLNFRVRQKDEFTTLARILNDMTGDWRKDIIAVKNQVIELNKSGHLTPKDMRALINLKQVLAKYKV